MVEVTTCPLGGDFDLRTEEPHQEQRDVHQDRDLEEVVELTDAAKRRPLSDGIRRTSPRRVTCAVVTIAPGSSIIPWGWTVTARKSYGFTINSDQLTEPLRQSTHLNRRPTSGSDETHRSTRWARLRG
jgi:hypothetical protein